MIYYCCDLVLICGYLVCRVDRVCFEVNIFLFDGLKFIKVILGFNSFDLWKWLKVGRLI